MYLARLGMYRLSFLLRRTSRKSCGGWTEPVFVDSLNSSAGRGSADSSPNQRWADPAAYSWKADPLRRKDFASSVGCYSTNNFASAATWLRNSTKVHASSKQADEGRNVHATCLSNSSGAVNSHDKSSTNCERLYSGRTHTLDEAEAHFQPYMTGKSIADNRPHSIMEWIVKAVDEIVAPLQGKSMLHNDDDQTRRALTKEELKRVGDRFDISRYAEVDKDVLRGMKAIHSPSGQLCDCDILKNRLVGLLFFGETERSSAFMQTLKPFHSRNSEDFVVVAISLSTQEMMNLTRASGFYHCTRYNGAVTVTSDVNMKVQHFNALPQLFILDGTTSHIITRGGVTAVSVNPETCLKAWIRGEAGYTWTDLFRFGSA